MKYFVISVLMFFHILMQAQQSAPLSHQVSTPIPVELMFGQRSAYYQHVTSKDILAGKYNFFNVSGFDAKWKDNQDSHFIISTFLSRNLGKGFSLGIGGEIQGPGSFITLGGQYAYGSEKMLIVLFPSVNLNGPTEYSQFSLFEYRPPINEALNAYFRGQFLLTTNFKELFRSYQQIRIGLQKGNIQFGYAMNLDQFHVPGIEKENYGAFVRMLLQ